MLEDFFNNVVAVINDVNEEAISAISNFTIDVLFENTNKSSE